MLAWYIIFATGRYGHTTVVIEGSMVVMGGGAYIGIGLSSVDYYNDVYYSDDKGISWQLATDRALWAGTVPEMVTLSFHRYLYKCLLYFIYFRTAGTGGCRFRQSDYSNRRSYIYWQLQRCVHQL